MESDLHLAFFLFNQNVQNIILLCVTTGDTVTRNEPSMFIIGYSDLYANCFLVLSLFELVYGSGGFSPCMSSDVES